MIACHRHAARLQTLLDSMEAHRERYAHDVIIVHNRGERDVLDLVKARGLLLLEREEAYQSRGDFNAAITLHPGYRYYLCLDDDTYVVRDDWLTAFLREWDAADRVGAVGNHYVRMQAYPATTHAPYQRRLRELLHACGCLDDPGGTVDFLESAAVMLRRDVLAKTGLWRLFEPGDRFATLISEVEMSVRLRRQGYRLRALPRVALGHKDHAFATLPGAGRSRGGAG
jgi:GT2 family glycosyltransferase